MEIGCSSSESRDDFSTIERLGTVITIREMLMIVAYLLTSGLNCKEVHAAVRKRPDGWQPDHAYYNCLFALPRNLTPDKLHRIPVLREIARLDPGSRASRDIDERIINEQQVFPEGEIDLSFPSSADRSADVIDAANGIDDIIGNPRNLNERQAEARLVQSVVRSLRRRAFFDGIETGGEVLLQLVLVRAKSFRRSCTEISLRNGPGNSRGASSRVFIQFRVCN